jgi:hypothetical protein
MSLPVVSERLVEQYARTLVGKAGRASHSRVLALRAQPTWTGPDAVRVTVDEAEHRVQVRPCASTLEIHEALLSQDDGQFLIVLTDRPDSDLGLDVLGRCFNQTVVAVDLWSAVLELFSARSLDPRLRRMAWAQEPLVERAPAGGWPTAVTGTVTRDHALTHLTASILGVPADRLDASGLLQWTLDPAGTASWRAEPDAVRHGIREWVREVHGDEAALALRIASREHQVDAVSLGVVADVLWPREGSVPVQAREARVRLEQFTGWSGLDDQTARQWADASLAVLVRMADDDQTTRAGILARASTAFGDLLWPDGAAMSAVLEEGYAQRLRDLASAVSAALDDPGSTGAVESAFAQVLAHDLAARDRRTPVARMAVRLVRWLATADGDAPSTLTAALERHLAQDAWVDRAASDVWVGSSDPEVAAAWRALFDAVRARRRAHDERTAALLADATASGLMPGGALVVERLVPEVVRPMAGAAPVLLVVVDGMSAAVAAEVTEGAGTIGWIELVRAGAAHRSGLVAVLPTLTTHSRTSLFAGELRTGSQDTEKRLFPAVSGGGVVFHKSDLVGAAGEELPAVLRDAMASPAVPVVAVVLNTVDDALAKHDPGGTEWTLSSIRHLEALLELAATTGRVVVLTSDHGHVVERGSDFVSAPGSDARFRPVGSGEMDPSTEVELRGSRVLAEGGAIIAAWVEDRRYGQKRAGYHGGASAAEVVIPLVVLARQPDVLEPAGWIPAPPQAPAWWNDPVSGALRVQAQITATASVSRKPAAPQVPGQGELIPAEPEPSPVVDGGRVSARLVEELLGGEAYAQQRARAGARALEDARVASMITALLDNNGRLHQDTLASAAGIPVPRIGPTLAALRRQLNVEGYEVVSIDPDRVTVLLDVTLLREQFNLES